MKSPISSFFKSLGFHPQLAEQYQVGLCRYIVFKFKCEPHLGHLLISLVLYQLLF